jgi:hypothetical protein
MGGIYETERMEKHVAECAQCKAAGNNYSARCDEWCAMLENVVDFENGEGPFEDKPDALMCDECDGPIDPNASRCEACGYQWCTEDVHTCSSSDCDEIELCGKPAVETVGGRPCCEEHKL